MRAVKHRARALCWLVALAACDEAPAVGRELQFSTPRLVWQQLGDGVRSVFQVEATAARSFATVTLRDGDDGDAVYLFEQLGATWGAPVRWVRAGGASSESVAWVVSTPRAAVLTRANGPAGTALFVREYGAAGWSAPVQITDWSTEAPGLARIAQGVAADGVHASLHVVYTVPGGSCDNGAQLRYRGERDGAWTSWRVVATACGVDSLSVATEPVEGTPIMVAWTSASSGDARDVMAVWSVSSAEPAFGVPFRVATGSAQSAFVHGHGSGRFFLTWWQTDAPRRAAAAEFDIARSSWSVSSLGWFTTFIAPVTVPLPNGGVLALGSDGDVATSRLVARRWASSAQPVAAQDVVATPQGDVTSQWLSRRADGSAQVMWVETSLGQQRVLWTEAAAVTADAGVADAGQ